MNVDDYMWILAYCILQCHPVIRLEFLYVTTKPQAQFLSLDEINLEQQQCLLCHACHLEFSVMFQLLALVMFLSYRDPTHDHYKTYKV